MDKPALRREMRRRRRALGRTQQRQAAHGLARSLCSDSKVLSARQVALYLSNDSEINPDVAIRRFRKMGKTILLPVLHPLRKGHLVFVEYRPNSRMTRNCFGIAEPDFRHNRRFISRFTGLICLPLVAFDNDGNRLGMGGGFYDRTLAFVRQPGHRPRLIGCAHECQRAEGLTTEPWDIPIDAIATDQSLIQARQSHHKQ